MSELPPPERFSMVAIGRTNSLEKYSRAETSQAHEINNVRRESAGSECFPGSPTEFPVILPLAQCAHHDRQFAALCRHLNIPDILPKPGARLPNALDQHRTHSPEVLSIWLSDKWDNPARSLRLAASEYENRAVPIRNL